jgi:Cu(I)/Ag(I) efflux system membrane fusion protein
MNKLTFAALLGVAIVAAYVAGSRYSKAATTDASPKLSLVSRSVPLHKNPAGAAIHIDAGVQRNLDVRIAQVGLGDLNHEIETIGKITRVDSAARSILASPTTGHLQFVAEKNEGDPVAQGELLFSVVSDDLMKLEGAYQAAAKGSNPAKAAELVPGLTEQGLTTEQIEQLAAGAEPTMPASVYSQQNGFVFIRRGNVGDEVTPGFTVFNLGGDKRLVEVTAAIFEQQWGWVKEGQVAELTLRGLPGVVFPGKVVQVDPPVGFTTRTLEVRIEFETDNEGISQNVFGRIKIKGQARPHLVMVPSEAVIRTEAGDKVVKVRKDGAFQTVPIVAGEESKGMTEILSGLVGGESIVVSGQFLIDSESARLADLARLSTNVADAGPGRHQY